MSALIAVELRRFWARRVPWILAALMLMGIANAGGAAFWQEGFDLRDLQHGFIGASVALMLVGLIVGASFIGAEWHAGTVVTLLTWEPRRDRVIVAKVIALLVSTVVLVFAALVLLGLVLVLGAATRGTTTGLDGSWWLDLVGVTLRVEFLACFAAVIGFGLGTIGRSTAGALGAVFGYMLVVENLIRGLEPKLRDWLVGENIGRFLLDEPGEMPSLGRSTIGAGLDLLFVACLILAVTVGVFRTRDVT